MKTACPHFNADRRRTRAFTLTEAMIATGIFLVICVGAMVSVQVFGMRIYTLGATKLVATADSRNTLNHLRSDIRAAKEVFVGVYTNGAFSRIPDGSAQTGNALELYLPDANDQPSATPIIFYKDPTGTSNDICSVSNSTVNVLADYVTNYNVFTAEDYLENVLSNYDNNPVIRVTLDFSQWEYPIGYIGNDALNAYNFYRLQTRVSRRAKE